MQNGRGLILLFATIIHQMKICRMQSPYWIPREMIVPILLKNWQDAAIIAGVDTGAVQEDVSVVADNISASGLLTITDVDVGESTFQPGAVGGTYGSLTIDAAGNWSYTADNTQAAIQQLDETESRFPAGE